MSFRIKTTNKHVNPSNANFMKDDNTVVNMLNQETKSTVFATSNTTFEQETQFTPRFKGGPAMRQGNNMSEDYQ